MINRLGAAAALALGFLAAPMLAAAGPVQDAEAALDRGDLATAGALARPLADKGDPDALYILGETLARAVEGTPDHRRGLAEYSRAAQLGQRDAQWRLGLIYAHSAPGWTADERLALTWYLRALAQGSMNAASALADAHERGTLGLQQSRERVYYYQRLYLKLLAQWVAEHDRPDATASVRETVAAHKQALIGLPAIWDRDASDLSPAIRREIQSRVDAFQPTPERR